uniref:Uncharacterized protein n=1 Tax=Oryza brachyantha TaxID=4533 RepID=J3LVU6_ORYBR
MAFFLVGIVVGDAAGGNNQGTDSALGRVEDHNPTSYGANSHISGRKLAASTDTAHTESLYMYCKMTGKNPCP